ncbi:MAG: hypothetical protein WAQ52_19695 [Terriglobales bacterium]
MSISGREGRTTNNRAALTELLPSRLRIRTQDMVMKAYLANLPTAVWALLALPALVVTRCVVATVVPQVVHAVVPEVVRTVLRII